MATPVRRALAAALLSLALVESAQAVDDVRRLGGEHVARIEQASVAARGGDPAAVQLRYDTARDLQAVLTGRTAPRCRAFIDALRSYAAANVRAAEAFDRQRSSAAHNRAAQVARGAMRRARADCRDGTLVPRAEPPALAAAEQRAVALLAGVGSPRAPRAGGALAQRLRSAAATFRGDAAIWVHDLASGRAAGVHEHDRYPAGSTVKLGVLVAALERYGVSRLIAQDLETMTRWSSNLAANRLHRLVGGDATVETTLRRLGAATSTYPGAYRAGTSGVAPPLVSRRVTTARDLGRVLVALHGAALGRGHDLTVTKLTRREASVALGLLLVADDRSGAIVSPVPAARKHGWLVSARHTAAVLYGPNGPVVAVVLTYHPGLTAAQAQRLGRRIVSIALTAGG
jgi:beta-lactamase family protein